MRTVLAVLVLAFALHEAGAAEPPTGRTPIEAQFRADARIVWNGTVVRNRATFRAYLQAVAGQIARPLFRVDVEPEISCVLLEDLLRDVRDAGVSPEMMRDDCVR